MTNIIEYCDKNNILWQPINLVINVKKKPAEIAGYMPKSNDYAKLSEKVIKSRQVHVDQTDYIAIYTDVIQQIDIDVDLGIYKTKGPYFESVTKKLPHYFIKLDTQGLTKVKKALHGCDLLSTNNGGFWSYVRKDTKVINSEAEIPEIKYSEILALEKSYKKLERVTNKIVNQDMDYKTWYSTICAIYNYCKKEGLDAFKVVHNFSRAQSKDKYDNDAIETINRLDLNKYPFNIEYLISLTKEHITKEESETDEPSNFVDEIVAFEEKQTSYTEFKTAFEEKAFYCVSMKKIIFHGFSDEFMVMSEPSQTSIYYAVGMIKEYGHILKYGRVEKDKNGTKKFKLHINTWLAVDSNKLCYYNYDFLPFPFPIKPTVYNLWTGFNKKKYDYTEEEKKYVIEIYSRFINHVGKSHENLPDFMTQYYSNIVQNPGTKEGILFVLTGQEGTFKGTLFKLISSVIGKEFSHEVADPEKVIGRFNSGLMKKLFCSLNEAVSYEMIQKSGVIKGLVTDVEFTYEQKGMPIVQGHNFTRFMICTNENIGAKATRDDRRNVYIETTKMDIKLRTDINEIIESEKYCCVLFDYFSKVQIKYKNITDWQNNRPLTNKHSEIINHFSDITYAFIAHVVKVGNSDQVHISYSNLMDKYDRYMLDYPKITKKTPKEFSLFMSKLIADSKYCDRRQDNKGRKGFVINKKIIDYFIDNKYIQPEEKYELSDFQFD